MMRSIDCVGPKFSPGATRTIMSHCMPGQRDRAQTRFASCTWLQCRVNDRTSLRPRIREVDWLPIGHALEEASPERLSNTVAQGQIERGRAIGRATHFLPRSAFCNSVSSALIVVPLNGPSLKVTGRPMLSKSSERTFAPGFSAGVLHYCSR